MNTPCTQPLRCSHHSIAMMLPACE
ncbi:MAG: hypothetical protein EOP49_04800 [Sphingobacteriales bacterium]|nr:MAG: hypothetical protein EOP49_04800 [Sphingobacteriales bacterium]